MKTISFVITGPPTADIGSFVEIVDDAGNRVDVGWWEHDGEHWCYRMPVELVPRLVGAAGLPDGTLRHLPIQDAIADQVTTPHAAGQNAGMSARQQLKEKLKGAKKKEVPVAGTGAEVEGATPAHWEKCPSCGHAFDPVKDELLDCGRCGESKCTKECLPNPVEPCVDCQALQAGPDEGGFDASATPPGVFTPGFTAATAAAKGAADPEDGDDE